MRFLPRHRLGLASSGTFFLPLAVAVAQTAAPLSSPAPGPAINPLRAELYLEGWTDFNKNGARDVYEDATQPVAARVEDLLRQMTLEEKTAQLSTLYGYTRVLKDELPTPAWKTAVWKDGIANIDEQGNGVRQSKEKHGDIVLPFSRHARSLNEIQRWFIEETRLGVPVDFTNEGIRGVCHAEATIFPAQINVGSTWNRALVSEIGRVTATEARALGYTHLYSPVLDVARDPRWGRVVECYGEDPYLVAELGVAQAAALQKHGIGSTLKHYAAYSIPKGGRDGMVRTDPQLGPRAMEELLLYPFKEVIRRVKPTGVMSSYNDYDGVPVSGSTEWLTDRLRTRYGFDGYVVSDSDAVLYLDFKHAVSPDYPESIAQFLEAGGNVRTEFNPPENFILPLRALVKSGRLPLAVVDQRVREVLAVKFRLGLFDRPYVADPAATDRVVHSDEHRAVSLRAARESIVLLKNANNTLPLAKNLKRILVTGPLATTVEHSLERYGPAWGKVIPLLDGIRAAVPDTEVVYAAGSVLAEKGFPDSELIPEPPAGEDLARIEEAVRLAADADVVILALGETSRLVGESKSRTSLELTGYQNDLVRALAKTGKPLVAVLLNGRALTINRLDRDAAAIVEAWCPGEWTGRAVADVLFGDYNPGGKLPVTFPKSVGQIPFTFPAKPYSQAGQGPANDAEPERRTRVLGALYPFGHGLSYTTFAYRDLKLTPAEIKPDGEVTVTCVVENTGARAGDCVVQLYTRDLVSSVTTNEKNLRGFERVPLAAGEKKTVSFTLTPRDLELINREWQTVVEPGDFRVMIGSSSEKTELEATFRVTPPNP